MKKLRLILVVFGLLLTIISSGQTLTYRLANPSVSKDLGGFDCFTFDVQVKSDVDKYLYSSQIVINFDNAAISTTIGQWSVAMFGAFGTLNSNGSAKYSPLKVFVSGATPKQVLIAVLGDASVLENGPGAADYVLVTNSYQTMVTVKGRISNLAGLAGITFVPSLMNGQPSFVTGAAGSGTNAPFANPNLYDATNFTSAYVSRIYANAAWSQAGTVGNVVDWTASLNTLVWGGTGTVGGGAESKAADVRVVSGATLVVPVNGKLTVSGNTELNSDGALTINSDATGTGSFITNTVSGMGTAVVNRFLAGSNAWHLISAPIGGQSITDFVNSGLNNIAYNPPKFGLAWYNNLVPAWVHYTSLTLAGAGNFTAGKGYETLRATPGTVSFNGGVATGPVPVAITNTGTNLWWNLLGNPYPSSININTNTGAANFLTANAAILDNDKTAVYIWNAALEIYEIYNQASAASYVPVGQGFFVKSAAGGGGVNFTAAMRTHSNSAFKSTQSTYPTINLQANISGKDRKTQVYFIDGTTVGVDKGYDAGVFEDVTANNTVSSRIEGSELDYGIQSLPLSNNDMTIALGLYAPAGVVSFSAEISDMPGTTKVYLEDRLTGKFTRMDEIGNVYTVNLTAASQGTGRFFLHTTQGTMGVDESLLNSNISAIALPREHKLRILGTTTSNAVATIYEMNGAVVGTKVLPNVGENEMPFMPISNGIYLLKVQQTGADAPTSIKINWIY